MENQTNRLAGAYVPQQLSDFISLYAVHKRKTKSKIIRDSLLTWMQESSLNISDLEYLISAFFQENWNDYKLNSLKKDEDLVNDFHDFVETIKNDLRLKGIPEQSISNIINGVKK